MIRKAKIEDTDTIVKLMMLAMGDLPYKFAATENINIAFNLLKKFVLKEGNQYSLNNVFVAEDNGIVTGSITAYDGANIEELRKPFFDYIAENFHTTMFNMESESEAGEFYIDALGVDPNFRGQGIGKKLILTVIDYAKKLGHQKVALLVATTKTDAKRLYENIGFVKVGYKNLLGVKHEHLVYQL